MQSYRQFDKFESLVVTVRERDTCLEYMAEHHPVNSACVCEVSK